MLWFGKEKRVFLESWIKPETKFYIVGHHFNHMYIRVKTAKNHEYAYLIENQWNKEKKKINKKVRAYLGRIYKLPKTNNLILEQITKKEINEYFTITSISSILTDLIKLELLNHGFKLKKELLTNNSLSINLENLKIYNTKSNKPITLQLNQGFLNEFTLNQLINFKIPKNKEDIEAGKILANKLALTGISINPEHFVSLFKKYKNL